MSGDSPRAPSAPVPRHARVAGQYTRATQRKHARRALAQIGVALAALLGAIGAFGLSWTTVVVEASVIATLLLIDRYWTPIIDRWRRGAQGEEHVAAILDGMRADGWFALHDISLGRGNVDHVLIGPAGIFTVETKSHRGRINAHAIDPRMLKQAYAEAKLIEGIMSMKVEPLLVFSNAYLTPAVTRREGVVILPARMLAAHLARRKAKWGDNRAGSLHARLAVACSTVSAGTLS